MRPETTSMSVVGSGSVVYGRDFYDEEGTALTTNPDHVPGIRQVIVSGIRLVANGHGRTFTYNTMVGPAIKDETFNVAFQGGEGPGLRYRESPGSL